MRDLRLFGTATSPLNASELGPLCRCPWQLVMAYLAESPPEVPTATIDVAAAVRDAARDGILLDEATVESFETAVKKPRKRPVRAKKITRRKKR